MTWNTIRAPNGEALWRLAPDVPCPMLSQCVFIRRWGVQGYEVFWHEEEHVRVGIYETFSAAKEAAEVTAIERELSK